MRVLVIDIGGTHVKVASTDIRVPIKIPSGPNMDAEMMARDVLAATEGWTYDCISIGYPGPVAHDRPLAEPHNLAAGWIDFPYQKVFGKPIRFINDAAMQALGGYKGGRMLFLGTGTGLGSAMIFDGVVIPLELAHLPYKRAAPMRSRSDSPVFNARARNAGDGLSSTSWSACRPRWFAILFYLAAVTPS